MSLLCDATSHREKTPKFVTQFYRQRGVSRQPYPEPLVAVRPPSTTISVAVI